MATVLLVTGVLALLFALNVHFPLRRPGELAVVTFGPAWWGGELPVHAALLFGGLGTALVASGALAETEGVVGLALLVASLLGPVTSWRQATRVGRRLGVRAAADMPWTRLALPFWFGDAAVRCIPRVRRDGERLVADLYQPRTPRTDKPSPILVYVHGGGWVLGFRRWQGRILIRRLVRAGWVCVSVEYRLSPWATWPDHIHDVKRALAWVERMAPAWGADPHRIAISGNSAGGHLAALAALAPAHPALSPDGVPVVGVFALVGWYGVYDLLDRARAFGHGALTRLWELLVMKRRLARASALFELASPLSHVKRESPPTLLVHGTRDTLVPIASARAMRTAFEERGARRCDLFEIEGAAHAFEVFWSRRGVYAVEAVAQWLEARVGELAR